MKDSGISLIEILIGVSITVLIGILLFNVLTSSNDVFVHQTAEVNQGLSANQASLYITNQIKASVGAVAQYPTSGPAQYIGGANVLILKLPALSQSNQIIDSVFDYAVILKDSDPKILRALVFPDSLSYRSSENRVLTTSLTKIHFDYLDTINNPVSPAQAGRINFIINLDAELSNESSASGVINLKNL